MTVKVTRTCPNCGTPLGQKNLCPDCDKQSPGYGTKNTIEQESADYIDSVIDFVQKHGADWDNEFISFFDQLDSPLTMKECLEACSLIYEILSSNQAHSDKISGRLLLKTMTSLQDVFPNVSDTKAREIATKLLKSQIAPVEPEPAFDDVCASISSEGYVSSCSPTLAVEAESFQSVSVPPVAASRNDIMSSYLGQKVKDLIVKQLAVSKDQVTEDARFVEDLNADSLDIVEMIMALEEEFGSEIPDGEAESLKTVGDAIRYIQGKMG